MAERTATGDQVAWVGRVLGVTLPGGGQAGGSGGAPRAPGRAFGAACAEFQAASEAVDAQIGSLQAALRGQEDGELQEIAEYGLNALTGNHRVRLMAALIGAQRGNAGDLAKLPALIAGRKDFLDEDDRVEACDDNPFGVAVSIRTTLGAALDRLGAAV